MNYEDLNDQEKFVDYPEQFVEELRNAYLSGNEADALTRAEEQGIDIREIIDWLLHPNIINLRKMLFDLSPEFVC